MIHIKIKNPKIRMCSYAEIKLLSETICPSEINSSVQKLNLALSENGKVL